MKSKIILPSLVAVAVIGGATLATTTSAYAESHKSELTDTQRTEKAEERKQKMEETLSAAVTKGTLTTEQKTSLEKKLASIEQTRKSLHDSGATRDEIHTAMKKAHEELKAWAEENNIALKDILPPHPRHGGPGEHGKIDKE